MLTEHAGFVPARDLAEFHAAGKGGDNHVEQFTEIHPLFRRGVGDCHLVRVKVRDGFDEIHGQMEVSDVFPRHLKSMLLKGTIEFQFGEIGFRGFSKDRLQFEGGVLLNAFNAIEYGEETSQPDLVKIGNSIFDSFLEH